MFALPASSVVTVSGGLSVHPIMVQAVTVYWYAVNGERLVTSMVVMFGIVRSTSVEFSMMIN